MLARLLATATAVAVPLSVPALGQDWFDAPRTFASPSNGIIRAVGDFDGDFHPDLLWVDPAGVQLWTNDGAGNFTQQPAEPFTAPRVFPFSGPTVQSGDLNGDLALDIVVPFNQNFNDGRIAILFGNGDGTFQPDIVIDLPNLPSGPALIEGLTLGDVDADGVLEIATATASSIPFSPASDTIQWWDWNGSAFVASASVELRGLGLLESLTAFDLDGDTRDDLVASGGSGSATGAIQVLPSVAGAPALGPVFALTGSVKTVAGDLDGDGDEDLLAAGNAGSCGSNQLTVLLNDSGSLAVLPTQVLPVAEDCTWSALPRLGDWDNDGDLDIIAHQDKLFLHLNDGANAFGPAESRNTEAIDVYQDPTSHLIDLNADGWLDFVGPRVFLLGSGGPLDPSPGTGLSFAQKTARDFDDDGDLDFIFAGGVVAPNNATGAAGPSQSAYPLDGPFLDISFESSTAIDDFSGDGLPDFLASRTSFSPFGGFDGMYLLENDGAGGTVAGTSYAMTTNIKLSAFGDGVPRRGYDVDGDGLLDLPMAGGVWMNLGDGTFANFVTLFPGVTEIADIGDVDGDGDLDYLTFTGQGADERYHLQRAGTEGEFAEELLTFGPQFSLSLHARFLDLDQDGDLDAVVPRTNEGAMVDVFENVGGVLMGIPDLGGTGGSARFVAADDVDGDGLRDLITSTFNLPSMPEAIQVHRRSGAGLNYEAPRYWFAEDIDGFADLDSDGDLDVFGSEPTLNLSVSGPDAGLIRQYGDGFAGAGGVVPILGASGPAVAGSSDVEIRLRRAVGGTTAILDIATQEGFIADFPLPGLTFLIDLPTLFPPFVVPVDGTPGDPGGGTFTLPVTVSPALIGNSFFMQVFVIDLSLPLQISSSQGLEVHFGAGQ